MPARKRARELPGLARLRKTPALPRPKRVLPPESVMRDALREAIREQVKFKAVYDRIRVPTGILLEMDEARAYVLATHRKTKDIGLTAERLGLSKRQVARVLEGAKAGLQIIELNRSFGEIRPYAMQHGLSTREFRERVIQTVKSEGVKAAAEKWGLQEKTAHRVRNHEIRRLYFDEWLTYRQIGPMFNIDHRTVGKICKEVMRQKDKELVRSRRRLSRKEAMGQEEQKLIRLRRFIRKNNCRIKEPKALREFMQQNYHRKNKVLAEYLGIEEITLESLVRTLGLRGQKMERRKEVMQAKIIALAEKIKARNPRELKFGYLAEQKRKGRSHLLNKIMLYFAKNPKEMKENSMRAYDRFLKAVGLTRKMVEMRRTPGISRKESKKRMLAYVTEPRPSGDFYSKPTRRKPYMGSTYLAPYSLKDLVQEGKLIKRRVRQYVYYYKSGQEGAMNKIEQEMRRK